MAAKNRDTERDTAIKNREQERVIAELHEKVAAASVAATRAANKAVEDGVVCAYAIAQTDRTFQHQIVTLECKVSALHMELATTQLKLTSITHKLNSETELLKIVSSEAMELSIALTRDAQHHESTLRALEDLKALHKDLQHVIDNMRVEREKVCLFLNNV
jgi:chromosome segregation ATPase